MAATRSARRASAAGTRRTPSIWPTTTVAGSRRTQRRSEPNQRRYLERKRDDPEYRERRRADARSRDRERRAQDADYRERRRANNRRYRERRRARLSEALQDSTDA
jgi:hypothetical protein